MLPSFTLFFEMANNFGQNFRENSPYLHLFNIKILKTSVYIKMMQKWDLVLCKM